MNRTLAVMLETEATRLQNSRMHFTRGNLWFEPSSGALWAILRAYGQGDNVIIELGRHHFQRLTPGDYVGVWRTRRIPAELLGEKYMFFGSIHNTTWGKEE